MKKFEEIKKHSGDYGLSLSVCDINNDNRTIEFCLDLDNISLFYYFKKQIFEIEIQNLYGKNKKFEFENVKDVLNCISALKCQHESIRDFVNDIHGINF